MIALLLALVVDAPAPGANENDGAPVSDTPSAATDDHPHRWVEISGPAARDPEAIFPPPPMRTDLSVGLAFTAQSFWAQPILGLAVFGDVTWEKPLLGLAFMRPSVRLSLGRTFASTEPALTRPDLGTHVQLTYASVEGCPFGNHVWGGRLGAVICARADAGALDAAPAGAGSESRFFSEVGVEARFRLALATLGTWRPIGELGAGFLAPLSRERLHPAGEPELALPAAIGALSIGAGIVFP